MGGLEDDLECDIPNIIHMHVIMHKHKIIIGVYVQGVTIYKKDKLILQDEINDLQIFVCLSVLF